MPRRDLHCSLFKIPKARGAAGDAGEEAFAGRCLRRYEVSYRLLQTRWGVLNGCEFLHGVHGSDMFHVSAASLSARPFFPLPQPLMHAISVEIRARERICPARRTQENFRGSESLALQTLRFCPVLPGHSSRTRSWCPGFGRRGRAEEVSSGRARGKRTVSHRPSATTTEDFLYFAAGSRRDRLRDRRK